MKVNLSFHRDKWARVQLLGGIFTSKAAFQSGRTILHSTGSVRVISFLHILTALGNIEGHSLDSARVGDSLTNVFPALFF